VKKLGKEIMVKCSELRKKSKRIESQLQVYDSMLKKLYQDCLYKVGDAWKSSENIGYINNFKDYLSDLEELEKSVQSYATFLQTAASKYEETEQKALTIIGSGGGAGGGSW
jgi:uncharacterized protein YukE